MFSWLSKQFHSEGRLSIGSTGHKNMHIGLGLGGSGLDAKGGIVGGTIELNKINTYGMLYINLILVKKIFLWFYCL